jgi:hypothetical protein
MGALWTLVVEEGIEPTFLVLVDAVTCHFNGQHPDVSWI